MTLFSTIACILLSCSTPQDAKIELPDTPIGPLCFSKDGKYLAVMLYEKTDIALVDLQTRKKIRSFLGLKRPTNAGAAAEPLLVFSPDSRFLVGGLHVALEERGGAFLPVWDVQTGKTITQLNGFDYRTETVSFTSDGKSVVTSGRAKGQGANWRTCIAVWESDPSHPGFSPAPSRSLELKDHSSLMVLGPGDQTFFAGMTQTGFKIHDIKTGALLDSVETPTPNGGGPPAYCATVSPDGKLLAVASGNMGADGVVSATFPGALRIWDIAKKSLYLDLPEPYLTVYTTFSPDGKWVATTSTGPRGEKSRLTLYDVEKGTIQRKIDRELPKTFNSASFTLDGQWLAIPGEKEILLWKMRQ